MTGQEDRGLGIIMKLFIDNVNIQFLVRYVTEIEMISSIISERNDKLRSNFT